MVNFEVASSGSFRDILRNHFVVAADIDDSIKQNARKAFCLKTVNTGINPPNVHSVLLKVNKNRGKNNTYASLKEIKL